ncbi:hypothetical protein [Paenibacillus sp. AN1007]|uniref:Uncharacterized protein n=1 Tax=Paenibacillus sp. AN1007 TaxID=3151385 RepID=A0AAU8NK04_9BACL
MTKDEIINAAESGEFIVDPGYQCFAGLDGTEARRYLESKGFNVVRNFDTGRNEITITTCAFTFLPMATSIKSYRFV